MRLETTRICNISLEARYKAEQYAKNSAAYENNIKQYGRMDYIPLREAFVWSDTKEGWEYWNNCTFINERTD